MNEANKPDQPNYFNDQGHLDQLAGMGVSVDRAKQFIADNPGDYDRLFSALHDDGDGQKAAGGGGGGGNGGSSQPANWESLLAKWQGMQPSSMQSFTEQFNAPGRRALSNSEWTGGNFAAPTKSAMSSAAWTGGNFDAPQLKDIADWTKSFKAPTADDMMQDPGYKWRIDEGRRQLEASAAAKGTLLTGGTLDSLMRLGEDYGSQEYGNVYNRRLGEFQDDFNMFNANRGFDASQNTDKYGRALQTFGTNYGLFGNERQNAQNRDDVNYGQALQTFGTNYGLFGNERQNAQALDESDYGRAEQEYAQRANIFQNNEANRYNSQRQNMMDLYGIDTGLYGRDFGERQQGFTEEMGRGNLALQTELGRGNLALQTELGRGNLGLGQQQFDLSKILGLGGMNQNQQQINNQASQFGQNFGEGQRMNSFNMFNTMDQNYINNLMGMGQLGINAGAYTANAGSGVADIMTQIGNVLGAGRVGQGNAWGNAAGTTANNAAQQAQLAQILRGGMYNNPNTGVFYNPGGSGYGGERGLM